MTQRVIPRLSGQQKSELIAACSNVVEYYTAKELEPLQAQVSPEGRLYTTTPYFNRWSEIADQNNRTYSSYRDFTSRTKITDCEKTPVYIRGTSENSFVIFVMTGEEKLYVQMKQKGTTQDTSLSNRNPILAAGRFYVDQQGKITEIVGLSGHYQPGIGQMLHLLEFLSNKGVNIDDIKVSIPEKNQ